MARRQHGEPEVVQTDLGRMVYHVARARLILLLVVVGLVAYCVLAVLAAFAVGLLSDYLSYR